jgi:hypothetical protein
LFLLTPIIIFTSLAPNASIILDAGDTGWKATLNNQKEFHNCLVYSIVFGDEMSVLFSIEMTTMACLK